MSSAETICLIIGADGFLGRNLCTYFDDRGWRYFGIRRKDGDLHDRASCHALFKGLPSVDRIFHVVTFQRTGYRQYEIPADLLDTNARIHLNVLECWARYQPQAKLISTGSSCAYPESPNAIPESLFQGGRLHDSVRAYGLAKQMLAVGSEVYASQYGLKYLHCLLATMYGPYDHHEPDRSHFVGGMLARALGERDAGKEVFTVWGAPDTVRECLYITDEIEAILAADPAFENTLLNCTANAPVTINEVARTICDVLDWDPRIKYLAGTFQGTSKKVLDSSRFLDATGWRPRLTLKEGLSRLADFLQKSEPLTREPQPTTGSE